jgi:ATP-dependent helicase HrpB
VGEGAKTRGRPARDRAAAPGSREEEEELLQRAVLAAFPDRVARRSRAGARELVLASGGSARLSEQSVVVDAPLLVAVDVDERPSGRSGAVVVRLASAIEPEWLLDLDTGLYAESDDLVWNAEAGRVERVTRIAYGSVVLEEARSAAPPSERASELLARAAIARIAFDERLELLIARLALLAAHVPEADLPELGADARESAARAAAEGRTTLAELEGSDLGASLLARLTPEQQRLVREQAPERITLPGGRSVAVHYERDKPPWIESRLQDFFGMAEGPRVCRGRVAVTLHLLAPNQRAVQVTTDLAGFWERHYPAIRRELMRRYPRHSWPEDGRTATPPAPRGRR